MTTATDFVATFATRGFVAWEASTAANLLRWPTSPVTFTDGRHTCVVQVSNDYATIGEPSDRMRMPLTPRTAQAILNMLGMQLPTPRMVQEIHAQATIRLFPHPMVPNRGADLAQYLAHSRAIDAQLAELGASPSGGLVSGHKKDVVVSNLYQPGKVLIYGWFGSDGRAIQGRSNVHGDFYVDYSHGIRPVSSACLLDGVPTDLTSVMQGPLYNLLSDEGPVKVPRYPAPNKPQPAPTPVAKLTPSGADLGLEIVRERVILLELERRERGS